VDEVETSIFSRARPGCIAPHMLSGAGPGQRGIIAAWLAR
jgi:hypothetical protein